MHFSGKFAGALVAVAALAACSGGGSNSTVPSTGQHVQSVQRRVMGSDGNVRVMFYTKDVELTGRVVSNPVPGGREIMATGSSNMLYNGGPIQPAPKIFVVYWGTWNSTTDPRGSRAYYDKFLAGIGGSSWLNTVSQYTQSGGTHVGNAAGSYSASTQSWNDTSSIPSLTGSSYQNALAAEAQKAAAHFANYSVSASYIIALPHGVKVNGFAYSGNWSCYFFGCYCAWHSTTTANGSTVAYTNLPYQPDAGAGCGQGSVTSPGYNDGVSIVGGHEQAETETDPRLNAWYDSSGSEIGDKCAWTGLANTSFSTGTFPTQPLWSNATSGCVQ